MDAMIVGVGGI